MIFYCPQSPPKAYLRREIMIEIKRLESVLSDILTDRYGKLIEVTLEGKDVNNNPDCADSDSGRSAQFRPLHDAV